MRRNVWLVCSFVLSTTLLTACWNSNNIQTMAYVTAFGLDYADGKYIAYVQVLNFSNVARSETTEVGKNVPVWIGKGEGTTVTEAMNSIYATSQLRLFWGHLKAIVFSERLIKKGGKVSEAYDMVNRYREIRYNVLMYGTKEELRDIFAQKSMLNFSPLDTLMDTPSHSYDQRSYIYPSYGYKVIAQYNEPAMSAMMPSLSIRKQSWSEDLKPKPMFRIDGAYFFHGKTMSGWMSESDLEGARWLEKKLVRSPVYVPDQSEPAAALVLIRPKPRIRVNIEGDRVYYGISVHIEAYVNELIRDLPVEELERMAAHVVEEQIRSTFEKGLVLRTDVLRLGEQLYRDHPRAWRKLAQGREFALDRNSLRDIKVKVDIIHSGKYKNRT